MAIDSLGLATLGVWSNDSIAVAMLGVWAPDAAEAPTESSIGGGFLTQRKLREFGDVLREHRRKLAEALERENAERAAVKRIAKKKRLKKSQAAHVISSAISYLSADASLVPQAAVALAPPQTVTVEEVAKIRAFWKAVDDYADELADEEDVVMLLL